MDETTIKEQARSLQPRTGRRNVFKAVGAMALGAGGVGAVAGCSPAAPAGAPYPTPNASATVPVAQVPEGGGVILADAPYVVTQPTAGEFKAFSKICTHQHCPVQQIKEQDIVCLCHGSEFSVVDGSVTRGPATQPLPEFPATVAGSVITITP